MIRRAALLGLVLLVLGAAQAAAECRSDLIRLRGDWGEASFVIEVADDPEERSRGLMFREDLPRGAGMLFIYDRPQRASFWMKNTLIPLDMLFIGPDGRVRHVHHEAVPGDLTPISGGPGVLAVLEINGGLARRYGIDAGSEAQHPAFAMGAPVWAC